MRETTDVLRVLIKERIEETCIPTLKTGTDFNEILSMQGQVAGLEWVLDRIDELTTED
jgi:hypothetical protein